MPPKMEATAEVAVEGEVLVGASKAAVAAAVDVGLDSSLRLELGL